MIVTDIRRSDNGEIEVRIRRYSPDQPRDDHGRFGEGDGGDSAGGGPSSPDAHGNYREGGVQYDEDGNRLTDSYVRDYGLPAGYSSFGYDNGGQFSVVQSTRGDYHIAYDRTEGGSGANVRDSADVRVGGLQASDLNSLASSVDSASSAEESGQTFTSSAGITATSGSSGSVTVSQLGRGGKDETFTEGEAVDMADSLRNMAEHGSG